MSKLGPSVNIILTEMQKAKQQGDNNALNYGFKQLYDLAYEYLVLFASRRLSTPQDADECALVALEKALRSIKRFNPKKDGCNWLLEATKNTIRDIKKKQACAVSLENVKFYVHAQAHSEDQLIENADLQKAIERLPEDDQKMVKYYYIDKYTLDEIAEKVQMSKSTVFDHLKKSIFTLKEILEENRTK